MSQIFKYLLVGAFNTALGYVVIFSLMYGAGLDALRSNVAGYLVGLSFSYFLNRTFTFKSNKKKSLEIFLFIGSFLVAYGLNLIALYFLIFYAAVNEAVSQLLAGIIYIGCSFVLQKYIVYRVRSILEN